jgi:hypothetical protein
MIYQSNWVIYLRTVPKEILLLPGWPCGTIMWKRVELRLSKPWQDLFKHIASPSSISLSTGVQMLLQNPSMLRSKLSEQLPEESDILNFSCSGYLKSMLKFSSPQEFRLILSMVQLSDLHHPIFHLVGFTSASDLTDFVLVRGNTFPVYSNTLAALLVIEREA